MSGPRLAKLAHKDRWSVSAISSGSTMQLSKGYDPNAAAAGGDGQAGPGAASAPGGEDNRTMYTTSVHIPPGGEDGLPEYDQSIMVEGDDDDDGDDGGEREEGLRDGEGSDISSAAKVRFFFFTAVRSLTGLFSPSGVHIFLTPRLVQYADRNSDPGVQVDDSDLFVPVVPDCGAMVPPPPAHPGAQYGGPASPPDAGPGGGGAPAPAVPSGAETVSLGTATQTHEVRMPMLLSTFKPATGCTNASDFVVRCFVARLRSGITVVKHGRSRWCKSRLRVLHVHPDGRSLSWKPALGEPSSGKRPPKLDLTSCREVRHAWSPDPENPMFTGTPILRQKCEAANAHKSFALIFPKRTVDITAVTADQCKVLMEGFSALCFRLQVAQNLQSGQAPGGGGDGESKADDGGSGAGAGTASVTLTNNSLGRGVSPGTGGKSFR